VKYQVTMGDRDDDQVPDAELLRDCRRRPEAFRVFYERHAEAVYAQLRNRVVRRDVALELTAETFAQALRSADRYRAEQGSASGWLAGIAKHLVATYLRRQQVEDHARRRLGIRELTSFADTDDETVDRLDAAARRGDLAQAIATLPADQRAALELRVLDEASYPAIAAQLGCSEGAARIRVHRGLTRLRSRLGGAR
jgi:RNA polymerase sigma factor (sigma-70 family)